MVAGRGVPTLKPLPPLEPNADVKAMKNDHGAERPDGPSGRAASWS
jgi:hypothetical protein